MKFQSFFLLLFSAYGLCSVLSNVRLVNHTDYCIEVISKTMKVLEERGWWTLKVHDYVEQLQETVLTTPVTGTVRYINSFVASIQKLDILPATVQQQWLHNTTSQITTVTVRGTMRMLDVAIGYDVIADVNNTSHRYTALHVQPLLSFAFAIIKDVVSQDDNIDVGVEVTVPTNIRAPIYRPVDNTSDILASTFNSANVNTAGIREWGEELRSIMLDVTNQVPFPTICYNCAITN